MFLPIHFLDLQGVIFIKQGFRYFSYSADIGIASNKKYYPDSFFRSALLEIISWLILLSEIHQLFTKRNENWNIFWICKDWNFSIIVFAQCKMLSIHEISISRNFFFQFLRAENNSLWFLLLNKVWEIDPIEQVSPDTFSRSARSDIYQTRLLLIVIFCRYRNTVK